MTLDSDLKKFLDVFQMHCHIATRFIIEVLEIRTEFFDKVTCVNEHCCCQTWHRQALALVQNGCIHKHTLAYISKRNKQRIIFKSAA